jgi:uncharacterized protein (TIRG00374 family)
VTTTHRSPSHSGRRRPAGGRSRWLAWAGRFLLLAALGAGLFGLLPQIGGLTHEATALRHARPFFVVAAVIAQGLSLASYAQLYRTMLAALGAKLRFRLAAEVIMASFLVSHLAPFGSAAGTVVNVTTLEAEGIAPATTGEAIALTTLVSTAALITLFGAGLLATAGRHVSQVYLTAGGAALGLVVIVIGALLWVGARPEVAARAGRWAGRLLRHLPWPRRARRVDPDKIGQSVARLTSLARTVLTGRAAAVSFGFAVGNLVLDLLSLDLMFLALGWQPGLGPLTVAYGAANIASVIPLTPGGLGIIEVTLVAITASFGTPKATAVLAVLGYRIVEFWLPLIPGAVAYIRLRLQTRGQ